MKTQTRLNREAVKAAAEAFSIVSDLLKTAPDGLDLSSYEDDGIPDGYIYMHAECVDSINESSIRALAKSLRIKQLIKAKASPEHIEYIRALLNLSKAEVDSNNIFIAAHTKNSVPQVVMFWKYC